MFRQATFSIEALVEMLHWLVGELARTMASLLFAAPADGPGPGLPAIDWTRLCDDASDDEVGYSFLIDPRNDWMAGHDDWVVRQILARPAAKAAWFANDSQAAAAAAGELRLCAATVADYLGQANRFRELLLAAVHFLGGQPARTTELLGARYCNTPYGGRRNVFIQHRMVCLALGYHKGYQRAGGQLKVVHRYLPQEVGEQVVRYLWLVLPFCQQIQALSGVGSRPSPYLWGTVFAQSAGGVARLAAKEGEEGGGDGKGRAASLAVWSSDKMRRVVQDLAARQLGTKLNISSWRHIAVAIGRRYLRGIVGGNSGPGLSGAGTGTVAYGDSETDGDGDELLGPDDPWDLQAGHSSRTAEMLYGREVQQGTTGLAARQEQFRKVSLA